MRIREDIHTSPLLHPNEHVSPVDSDSPSLEWLDGNGMTWWKISRLLRAFRPTPTHYSCHPIISLFLSNKSVLQYGMLLTEFAWFPQVLFVSEPRGPDDKDSTAQDSSCKCTMGHTPPADLLLTHLSFQSQRSLPGWAKEFWPAL